MASAESEPVPHGPAPLPALDFTPPTNDEEQVEALKLIADSIAQRRQLASYALMTHPYFLGLMGLAVSIVYKWLYKSPSDWALIFTTSIGILMAGFVGIRGAVSKYIELAESVNYKWLDRDEVVVARWGDGADRKVIGSVVYKIEKASGSGSGRKGKKIATIRAWTTRQRMRNNGVGKGLIEETVKQAKLKGADEIRWEEGNIYEKRILPSWANSGFESGLKEARKKLEGYVQEYQGKK